MPEVAKVMSLDADGKYFAATRAEVEALVNSRTVTVGDKEALINLEAIAKQRGYWEVVSDDAPRESTRRLSDGTVVPVVWLKPERELVQTIPPAPLVDVYDRTITVPLQSQSYVYEADGVSIPRGATTTLRAAAGTTATITAKPAPGWVFFSDYQWRFGLPNVGKATWKFDLPSFTGIEAPTVEKIQVHDFGNGIRVGGGYLFDGGGRMFPDDRPNVWRIQDGVATWITEGFPAPPNNNKINTYLCFSLFDKHDLEIRFTITDVKYGARSPLSPEGMSVTALTGSNVGSVYKGIYIRQTPDGGRVSMGSHHYYGKGNDVHVANPIGEWVFTVVNGQQALKAPSGEVKVSPVDPGFTKVIPDMTGFMFRVNVHTTDPSKNTRFSIGSVKGGVYA